MEANYKIGGMTCGGCVGSVERALSAALPGVTVEVSLADNAVKLTGTHDAVAVKAAIEDAGFDFSGPSAD